MYNRIHFQRGLGVIGSHAIKAPSLTGTISWTADPYQDNGPIVQTSPRLLVAEPGTV